MHSVSEHSDPQSSARFWLLNQNLEHAWLDNQAATAEFNEVLQGLQSTKLSPDEAGRLKEVTARMNNAVAAHIEAVKNVVGFLANAGDDKRNAAAGRPALVVQSERILVEFLLADLNVAFTFLGTADALATSNLAQSENLLAKARAALVTIRGFDGA